MIARSDRPRRRSRSLLLYAAVLLATVSQLAFNLLPLFDGWHGIGSGAHVEAVGGAAHYAHAEDTCAACQVHAVDALPFASVRVTFDGDRRESAPALGGTFAPAAAPTASHRSRAPPTTS